MWSGPQSSDRGQPAVKVGQWGLDPRPLEGGHPALGRVHRQVPTAQGSVSPASMAQDVGQEAGGRGDGGSTAKRKGKAVKSWEDGAGQDLHSPGLSFLI